MAYMKDSAGVRLDSFRAVRSVAGKSGAVQLSPFDVGAIAGPVAGSSKYPNQTHASDIDTLQGYMGYVMPADTFDLQWVFANASQAPETPGPQFTLRAALEYPEGTFTPVFFAGKRDVVVEGGGRAVTDPVAVDVPKGALAILRYRLIRAAGVTTAFPTGEAYGYVSGGNLLPSSTKFNSRLNGLEMLKTRTVTDGAMTSGSAVLTSATAAFTAQDAGQNISVAGAGASVATVTTTILTYTSATQVTLATSAGTTVSGASVSLSAADKTMSGTIYNSQGQMYGYSPLAVLGRVEGAQETWGLVGDSITQGQADAQYGGWAVRSLAPSKVAQSGAPVVAPERPYMQSSQAGEQVSNLVVRHATRYALLGRCTHILGMIGTNDIGIAENASLEAPLKANLVTLWRQLRRRGSKPIYGTITPRSTGTFTSVAGQTTTANNQVRLNVNAWLRDGAPIDATTLAPVAVGTAGAIRARFYGTTGNVIVAGTGNHPAEALFELADTVESARDSGLWAVDPGNASLADDGLHPNARGNARMAAAATAVRLAVTAA